MNVQILHALPWCVVLVGVLVAASTDLWKFKIHNLLTLPLILSGMIYHAFTDQTIGLSFSVWGILIGTLPFLVLYMKGGMGAGDIKLMASVGAWMGPWFTLHVIIVSGLATGCYSAVLMILNRPHSARGPLGMTTNIRANSEEDLWETATDIAAVLKRPNRRANAVPFGAMVALGVFVTEYWIE